jgi:hypothetical protein
MTPSREIFVRLVIDGMHRAHQASTQVWERTNKSARPQLIAEEGQLDAADIDDLPFVVFLCSTATRIGRAI